MQLEGPAGTAQPRACPTVGLGPKRSRRSANSQPARELKGRVIGQAGAMFPETGSTDKLMTY
jgi:hypothetical protein